MWSYGRNATEKKNGNGCFSNLRFDLRLCISVVFTCIVFVSVSFCSFILSGYAISVIQSFQRDSERIFFSASSMFIRIRSSVLFLLLLLMMCNVFAIDMVSFTTELFTHLCTHTHCTKRKKKHEQNATTSSENRKVCRLVGVN